MRSHLSLACVTLLLLAALAQADIVNDEGEETVEWTFMVYLDSDNNLEGAGIEDMNEMETVGSSGSVNVVVQMDRAEGYDTSNGDWEGAKRFLVSKDNDPAQIGSEELEDLGEVNMGDPGTLVDFVNWSVSNYPARKYALVLWNHGGAFWGVAWDEDTNGSGEEHDMLSMVDLRSALENIEIDVLGKDLDLLGFDACLMANMGVLYQLRHNVDVAVGSGYVEPGEGWPYERILPDLVDNPHMNAADLGRIISNEYVDSYSDREGDPDDTTAITMAAFDLESFGELGHSIDLMAKVLALNSDVRPRMGHWLQIQQARSDTNSYDFPKSHSPGNQIPIDPGGYCNYDIIDLMDNLQKYIPMDNEITSRTEEVKRLAREATIHYRATGYSENVKGAHGLTLYFPSGTDNDYSETYDTLDLANETYWDDFLHFYHSKENAPDTPPSILIQSPRDGMEYDIDHGVFGIRGRAHDLQGEVGVVEYRIDGGEWVETTGSNDWNVVLDTRNLGVGYHLIEVRADGGGGQSLQIRILAPERGATGHGDGDPGYRIWAAGAVFMGLVVLGVVFLGRRKKRA